MERNEPIETVETLIEAVALQVLLSHGCLTGDGARLTLLAQEIAEGVSRRRAA